MHKTTFLIEIAISIYRQVHGFIEEQLVNWKGHNKKPPAKLGGEIDFFSTDADEKFRRIKDGSKPLQFD